jgi:hypothetical protein
MLAWWRRFFMGLDVFAIYPLQEPVSERRLNKAIVAPDELFEGIVLKGSGRVGSSFRGRPYEDYVVEVTGNSLYFFYMAPDEVKKMAEKLESGAEEISDEDLKELELTREDVRNLARWFKIAAANGFALHGSF